jgi:hypothetical protein
LFEVLKPRDGALLLLLKDGSPKQGKKIKGSQHLNPLITQIDGQGLSFDPHSREEVQKNMFDTRFQLELHLFQQIRMESVCYWWLGISLQRMGRR